MRTPRCVNRAQWKTRDRWDSAARFVESESDSRLSNRAWDGVEDFPMTNLQASRCRVVNFSILDSFDSHCGVSPITLRSHGRSKRMLTTFLNPKIGSLHGKSREVMMLRILRRFGEFLTMRWIHSCCCCFVASFPQNFFLSRVSGCDEHVTSTVSNLLPKRSEASFSNRGQWVN